MYHSLKTGYMVDPKNKIHKLKEENKRLLNNRPAPGEVFSDEWYRKKGYEKDSEGK